MSKDYFHLGAEGDAKPAPIQVTSEGAFREGARAMRDAIGARLAVYAETRGGDTIIDVACELARSLPLPDYTPPPTKPASVDWEWWSGQNDEFYTNGPFDTREEAIEALDGYGGHVIEAVRGSVRFSADCLIESQYFENENYFSSEYGEPDRTGGADVIAQADAELQALLDAWLDRWRHTFVAPEMFTASRNHDSLPVDYTDDGPLDAEEEAALKALNALPDGEIMHWQRERREYFRERKAFFEGKSE